ncbi:GNAT family N-acetyltransferase [Sphingorhabdus contaminans]|uniref:GNAT family N-acetyltransferase n=1 Tax=Sphingorhabdus contaminans TaxID=1343899 RepID=A0A553WJK9_9SPHN|nr:GNAT family N-acetyltransferase [Sphingorhabdus contaminans]TSB04843.1 GNAT family N-acetyltransferase [Sphingorhabdus contaminans]
MATRALHAVKGAGDIHHQFSGWRTVTDAAFISAWDDLAAHAAEPNIFSESWFLRPALEQFDAMDKVRLFTLWDGDQLCGLMPLATLPRYGRWPIPHVQNWLHHNAFLGSPLVRKGYADCFWRELLTGLDTDPGQALFFHINGLTIGGEVARALEVICDAQRRRCALVQQTDRALLEQGLTPAVYYEQAVRSKKRKELRRQKNRLAEEGALTFTRDDSSTGLAEWTEEFLALEKRGWKGRNGSALASFPETRALFSEVLAGAAALGKVERLDLRLEGRPLAMLVNFHSPPGSFSFKTAFDEDFARYSPGVLLQIENLALLDRADIKWCDSCAAQGHPMIDSIWTGRRSIGRYSIAIGGAGRRTIFGAFLKAELARSAAREVQAPHISDSGEES